jgi:hypothetical protein
MARARNLLVVAPLLLSCGGEPGGGARLPAPAGSAVEPWVPPQGKPLALRATPLLDVKEQDCSPQLQSPAAVHFRKLDAMSKAGNDTLAVSVGETLCLDAAMVAGRLVNFRAVGTDFPRDQTMRVSIRQLDRGGYDLAVFNPSPKILRFRVWLSHGPADAQTEPSGEYVAVPGMTTHSIWLLPADMVGVVLDSFELRDMPPRVAGPGGPPPPAEDCVAHLLIPAEHHFHKGEDAPQGTQNDTLAVGVGETLCLSTKELGDRLVDFQVAGPDLPKERTMRVELQQRQGMYVLVIRNPSARTLRYQAVLLSGDDKDGRAVPTNVLPIRPGLVNFESWPASSPLTAIGLHHFELLSDTP